MDSPPIAQAGEFALIARLRARIAGGEGVDLGLGDDAASVVTGARTLAAADMLVEGTHFDPSFSSPRDAGYKAIAVNVSDLAAMGGRARYVLVSLGVPATATMAVVDALYDGMLEACAELGCSIVGGDTVIAPVIVLSIATIGDVPPAGIVTRSAAREGDALCVTGSLGAAAAGLALLRAGDANEAARKVLDTFPDLARAHRRPQVRDLAGPLAAAAGARAMIDVSDGFARDAAHIAEESGTGVRIDAAALPIAPGVAEAADALDADVVMLAAAGGDDYELAMAIPDEHVEAVRTAIAPLPLTVAGRFEGDVRTLEHGSRRVDASTAGWEHFA